MPAQGAFEDPLISAWFSLDFQGTVAGAFRECSGLGSENEIVESKSSGPKGELVISKQPGRMKWNNITLKRGITSSMDMWKWRKLVEQGNIKDARKNGTITMHAVDGSPIAKWDFFNAWPSKLTGPNGNATNNEVGIEELEITHEGYDRTQ
jgi:phage tail-like protein